MTGIDRTIDFEDLVGEEFDFYGVEGNCFKLNNTIYEAIEGEEGLDEVRVRRGEKYDFHTSPIARVVIENGAFNDESYQLTDLHDGHCWLEFGTTLTAFYDVSKRTIYTGFVFEYTPKAPPQ